MSTQARTRIKRHEPERLGGSSINHLPDIYAHSIAHHRHLICKAYVDHAKGILKKLNHLGNGRVAHWHNVVERTGIKHCAHCSTLGCDSPDDLGNVASSVERVSGIDPFRRKAQEDVST